MSATKEKDKKKYDESNMDDRIVVRINKDIKRDAYAVLSKLNVVPSIVIRNLLLDIAETGIFSGAKYKNDDSEKKANHEIKTELEELKDRVWVLEDKVNQLEDVLEKTRIMTKRNRQIEECQK